jgi:hypothetical protein
VKICRPGLAEELKVKNKNTIHVSAKGLTIVNKFFGHRISFSQHWIPQAETENPF